MIKFQIAIVPIQTKKIKNFLLDSGMRRKEGVMENVIVHVVYVGALRGKEYLPQGPQNIVGNMDMLRVGMDIIHL